MAAEDHLTGICIYPIKLNPQFHVIKAAFSGVFLLPVNIFKNRQRIMLQISKIHHYPTRVQTSKHNDQMTNDGLHAED